MPLEASSGPIKDHIPDVDLKIYENAAHGLYYTAAKDVMRDIIAQID